MRERGGAVSTLVVLQVDQSWTNSTLQDKIIKIFKKTTFRYIVMAIRGQCWLPQALPSVLQPRRYWECENHQSVRRPPCSATSCFLLLPFFKTGVRKLKWMILHFLALYCQNKSIITLYYITYITLHILQSMFPFMLVQRGLCLWRVFADIALEF